MGLVSQLSVWLDKPTARGSAVDAFTMPGAPGLVRRLERMGHFAILSFGEMTKKWSKPMAWSDKFNHPIKRGCAPYPHAPRRPSLHPGTLGVTKNASGMAGRHKLLSQASTVACGVTLCELR